MDVAAVRRRIEEIGIIPAVRTASTDDAQFASETLRAAGIPVVEITMTIPGALTVIEHLASAGDALVVGAGTVLDVETARRCLDAGAHFITSPGFDPEIVRATNGRAVSIPGALTPTEVTRAYRAGADFIKVFPVTPLGGPAYLRALAGPFPAGRFVPAGGIDHHAVAAFVSAGAAAIGVGKELLPRRAIADRRVDWIAELARRFVTQMQDARRRETGP
ncbi:MAG TPA: bifunctional 4-hydroxy-2-oxoglutarate aldolase/2-dehydro-3-deoxy-phosphogluconate aldolase [Vicinamibacterales bacterium]|jgi:2-dehydro-3-deoxyphosphogluconate aldolase/(4S)-4-hydroxy-2-oxoglutarate aldolase|nr:bifunctional 4-hydroxy-2-oxoglutarate aldolase/2-dehydro-3-deoxy-phosphogluconate aldolase [Vicinamibacterales bacterium]